MQDPTQQKPGPRSSTGYRPLVPSDLTRNPGAPTVAYVGAAAGFGLAAGVAIALAASFSHAGAVSHGAHALAARAGGLGTLPAVYAASAPTLLSSVDLAKKPSASPKAGGGPQLLTLAADVPGQKPAGAHRKHRLHRLWHWKKGKSDEARRKPYVSPNEPEATADQPTGLERANAAAASGPFFLGIEGDVTVASYDVAAGRIQTYEGSNFMLDRAAASGGAIRWQDFPFNVHYRCDGMGNCTLMRGGAAEIAKLTR
jgi:hypothetical protein